MKRFLFLALLLAPSLAWGAPPTLKIPPEVQATSQYVEVIPETDAASILYVGLSGVDAIPSAWLNNPVAFRIDTRGLAVGRYRFVAVAAGKEGEQSRADFALVIGTPPVVVVPPGPGPPTPPTPPVPVPVVGPRALLIVRETEDSNPELGRLITNLRAGPPAKYLKDKGHTLATLDDDSKNEKDAPSSMVEAWRPHYSGMKLPVLFIIDPATKALMEKRELPTGTTGDTILDWLRAKGG